MRSNLGTRSRLAAHILAVIVLALMLIYISPDTTAPATQTAPAARTIAAIPAVPVQTPPEAIPEPIADALPETPRETPPIPPAAPAAGTEASVFTEAPGIIGAPGGAGADAGTLDQVQTPSAIARTEADALRPPAVPPMPADEAEQPVDIGQEPPAEAIQPPEDMQEPETIQETEDAHEPEKTAEPEAGGAAQEEQEQETPEVPAESAEQPEPEQPAPEEQENAPTPETPETAETPQPDPQPLPQPDESGSLVVAAPETGAINPVAAATPLPNATLEVLGDGVYWLDPRRDLETELAAIPELRSLILLVPLPGHRVTDFDHVKTEIIPADPADLTEDAAERFIHLTDAANRPVAVAALPGARGAAFFKGAYLLRNRALSAEEMLREIAPELDDAGTARDDIIHRLTRMSAE